MKHINLSYGWMDNGATLKIEVAFGSRRGKYESITFPLEGVRTSRIYIVEVHYGNTLNFLLPREEREKTWKEEIFRDTIKERAEVVAADFKKRWNDRYDRYLSATSGEAEKTGGEFLKEWEASRTMPSVVVVEGLPSLPENSFVLEDTGEVLKNRQHRWKIKAGRDASGRLLLFAGLESFLHGDVYVEGVKSTAIVIRQARAGAGGMVGLQVAALFNPGDELLLIQEAYSSRHTKKFKYSWDGKELKQSQE